MSLNIELHAKTTLLYPILQNLDSGIAITDTSTNIILINKPAARISDLQMEDRAGKPADIPMPLELSNWLDSGQRPVYDRIIINGSTGITEGSVLHATVAWPYFNALRQPAGAQYGDVGKPSAKTEDHDHGAADPQRE